MKPKATSLFLVGIWILYAIALNVFISSVWWGLYQEDILTRLFAMSLTALPMFILGIPFLFVKSKCDEVLKKDEKVIMAVITSLLTGSVMTIGYIGDLSKHDWFAYLLVLIVAIFMFVLYICMACNMSGTKKLALYLVKCFVVSFIPAIFICLGLTSLITALAEFKAIFIIVYILANTIPGAVVIIWVRVK